MMLAQANVEIPWHYLPPWLFGLIAFLSVALLALMVVYYAKKLFGRRPPIDDELEDRGKKLRSEIYHAKNSLRKELLPRIEKSEGEIEQIKIDRERKWQSLQDEYHRLDMQIAKLGNSVEILLNRLEGQ